MFKKKIKKDTLIHKGDFDLNSEITALEDEEKKGPEVAGILEESKKIKKRSIKGIEANPKVLSSPPAEEKNQKEMTGLLDKEFLRQTGKVDIVDRNLEKHLSENLLSDPFGGKFRRTKAPTEQKSILKALEPELAHVFKINELSKSLLDEAKDQTQWTSGMMEVQLSLDHKVKNIEASEAAKSGKVLNAEPVSGGRRGSAKKTEDEKEHKKKMKEFERAFKKEGRRFVRDQMAKKHESSMHENFYG